MITRTIDNKRRIVLPKETLGRFKNSFAYFQYDAQKREIYILGSEKVLELKENLEMQYGRADYNNADAKAAMRKFASNMSSSYIHENGRIVIPQRILHSGEVYPFGKLEMEIKEDLISLRNPTNRVVR